VSFRLIKLQWEQTGIKLHRSFDAPDDQISADADQLHQVFFNFLLNATDAMGEGGDIYVTSEQIGHGEFNPEFGDQANGIDFVRISIRDTGAGIKPEDLPNIFDPFFSTKTEGTGMGLSVALGIINEHHGHIDVESEFNRGTTFHITLPLLKQQVMI